MNPLYFPDVPQKMGLYPVVDSIDWLSRLLNAGVRTLQLRLKTPSFEKHNPTVTQSVAPGRYFHARVFINDDWQQAIQHRAYGVHLGQTDLDGADLNAISEAGLRPGISTHDDHEIDRALAIHSSYIALGHVFATQTKIMATSPQGLPLLAGYVARLAEYPNVAIGGISLAHAPEVLATGVGNIAVISAITQAPDWRQATGKLLALTGSGGNETS